VKVEIGQTVRGAADIIAVLENPIHTSVNAVDPNEYEPLVGRETPA
jgi:hypothetical protein